MASSNNRPITAATFDFESVRSILDRYVDKEDRLLIAISGGADSVGLVGVMLELGIAPERISLVYVNHGIRLTTGCDLEAVRALAERFFLPLTVCSVNAREFAREKRWSLEQAARTLRYDALRAAAQSAQCMWILTGHTLDDAAETVMMRMRDGGPWYEWTPIPECRGNILRPLIGTERRQLRDWVTARGMLYSEDETNADRRFRRNKLRAELAARPKFWNTATRARTFAAAEAAASGLSVLRAATRIVFPALREDPACGKIGLAIHEILQYFSCLTFVPVEVAWARLAGVPDGRLPSAARRQISDCLHGKSPSAKLRLPYGIRLIREGGEIWLAASEVAQFEIPLRIGRIMIPLLNAICELRMGSQSESLGGAMGLNPGISPQSLVLRTWRPGDRIRLPRRPTKKIADLLAEARLDPFARERVWVLADPSGLVAVAGFGVAERALPPPNAKRCLWFSWNEHSNRIA